VQAQDWRKSLENDRVALASGNLPRGNRQHTAAFLSNIAPWLESVNAAEVQCSGIAMAALPAANEILCRRTFRPAL
jgi:hypothetical protein